MKTMNGRSTKDKGLRQITTASSGSRTAPAEAGRYRNHWPLLDKADERFLRLLLGGIFMGGFLKRLFGGRSYSDNLTRLLEKEEQKRKSENRRWAEDIGVAVADIVGILSAAKNGNKSDFKRFLTKEPRLVRYRSRNGTLLHVVCQYIMYEQTAVHAMVEALLEAGVDVNATDDQGLTVFHNVVRGPLHQLSHFMDIAQLLMAHGANVHATDSQGRAPIHLAETVPMIDLLLKNGADINTKDDAGHTPLDGLLFHLGGALRGQRHMEGDSHATLFVREYGGVSPMEEVARVAYDGLPEDEKLALMLCWSGKHWGVLAGGGDEVERTEVRKIGQHIYEQGGMARMLKVHRRVVELGGDGRYLEYTWHGIGEWLG